MEARGFMEKLVPAVSFDVIDLAGDLELVLAEEVKYLRRVVEAVGQENLAEKDALVRELRGRLADKDREIARLAEENRTLREHTLSRAG
jgi:hypothetical protein